jgi:hypothetical protein
MSKMGNEIQENKPSNKGMLGRTAWIPLQAGCLTLTLSAVAILVGLWLDTRLGTAPQWMLILLIASAPFALGGVFLLTRRALRKIKDQVKTSAIDEDE